MLDSNETWIFSTDFRKTLEYQISWKSVRGEKKYSMWTDRQTDRQVEANSRFLQFFNVPRNAFKKSVFWSPTVGHEGQIKEKIFASHIINNMLHINRGRDSSVGIATRYGLDGPGIESRWARDFPDRPWGPPSVLYSGYRVSLPGVKRPGRGVDQPPPSSAEVKERVQLYLYSPCGPSWPVLGWTSHLRTNTLRFTVLFTSKPTAGGYFASTLGGLTC
jgi:hypothetical protein